MGKRARQDDAERAFGVIAQHLASKRTELRVAVEYERGVEGWLQHECLVALDNAYYADTSGRIRDFGREAMLAPSKKERKAGSTRRPFDLWFGKPQMVASMKMYLPWQSVKDATQPVRRDLKDLAGDPRLGFFLLGRLDYHDGRGCRGGKRRGPHGTEWCNDLLSKAGRGLSLTPLASSVTGGNSDYLEYWLPPLTDWPGDDDELAPRTPVLILGAWICEKN